MVSKKELFDQLKIDIEAVPPKLDNITLLLQQYINGLCMFCPSKTDLNNDIKSSFPTVINIENTIPIIKKLIYYIEKFQSPADDIISKNMLDKLINNYSIESIIIFLEEYYDHTEKVYKETWEARERLLNGENIVPPKHRPSIIKNKYNIPNNMKTGFK